MLASECTMIYTRLLWLLFVTLTSLASAQTFEVASLKLPGPDARGLGMSGGPGTSEPARLRYANVPLYRILKEAYGVMPYDIVGPSWMNDARYDVNANIPEGATREQFTVMLQNLLAERLNLAMHRETREQTVYVLGIGRGGSKLRAAQIPAQFPSRITRYSLGPTLHMEGKLQTDDQIAQMLGNYVGARVVNKTGLTGQFDFELQFAGDDSPDTTGGSVAGCSHRRQLA